MTARPPEPDPKDGDRTWRAAVIAALLAVSLLPALLAAVLAPPDLHPTGAMFFEPDDHFVMAVMEEGRSGRWLHHPPYGPSPSEGGLFYLPYLAAGHLSRGTGIDVRAMFQLFRVACGVLLLLGIATFVRRRFAARGDRRFAFLLAAIGSGLGWIGLFFQGVPKFPDLYATETYPGFSLLVSGHLALGLASMLGLFDALRPDGAAVRGWATVVVCAVVLALIQPFALVVALAVGALDRVAPAPDGAPRASLARLVAAGALAAPFVAHESWAIAHLPAFSGWRLQLETLTPPLHHLLVAGGVALPLAVLGAAAALRERRRDLILLLAWVVVAIVLMQVPWYQQRRFDVGLWVPIALLAAHGAARRLPRAPRVRAAVLVVSALTTTFLLGSIGEAVVRRDATMFVSDTEWDAVAYLRGAARPGDLLLASALPSRFALTRAPLHVVYANPVETPDRERARATVGDYFRGGSRGSDSLLATVRWILVGPRERSSGEPLVPDDFREAWRREDVVVWRRR